MHLDLPHIPCLHAPHGRPWPALSFNKKETTFSPSYSRRPVGDLRMSSLLSHDAGLPHLHLLSTRAGSQFCCEIVKESLPTEDHLGAEAWSLPSAVGGLHGRSSTWVAAVRLTGHDTISRQRLIRIESSAQRHQRRSIPTAAGCRRQRLFARCPKRAERCKPTSSTFFVHQLYMLVIFPFQQCLAICVCSFCITSNYINTISFCDRSVIMSVGTYAFHTSAILHHHLIVVSLLIFSVINLLHYL